MTKHLCICVAWSLCAIIGQLASAQEEPVAVVAHAESQSRIVEYEHEIDAGIEDVWEAFTTNDGLMSWMAPIVKIELRIGGKIKSNYNKAGLIGDASTIENTILCYEPERMLSLQATKFPAGFQFKEAATGTWSIFYFSPISPTQTRVRVVGLGYRDDEQSKKMKSFFAGANKHSLDELNRALSARGKPEAPK